MKLLGLLLALSCGNFAHAQTSGSGDSVPDHCEGDNGYDPCAVYHLNHPPAFIQVCTDNGCYSIPNPAVPTAPAAVCHPDGDNPCATTGPANPPSPYGPSASAAG